MRELAPATTSAFAAVIALTLATQLRAQDAIQTLEGDSEADALGVVVRTIGDVNGDDVLDFAAGAPGDDGNGTDAGSVAIYSGIDGKMLQLFRGKNEQDGFGYCLADAQDVNKDGYPDLVVGAPHQDSQTENGTYQDVGSVQVFSGRDGQLLWEITGQTEGEALGWSVAGLGDIDRDGHADFAAGAPFHDQKNRLDIGRVAVFSGKNGKMLYEITGTDRGDRFGWALARVEDLDGDRSDDFLVGVEGSSWRDKQVGSARLFSGRRGKQIRALRTGEEGDYFGAAVASPGDVDGDGRSDLLVGAWNGLNSDGVRSGVAIVFSGRTGAEILRVAGNSPHDRFGAAVAGIGDFDGDGHADFAVGSPQETESGSGYVQAFSGADGSVLFTLIGEVLGDSFGTSVDACADRDEDGLCEILVGAPGMRGKGGWQVFRGIN